MKRATIVLVLLMAVTGIIFNFSAAAYGGNEFDVYLKAESFTWKEFDDSGDQLLKESGPVFGVGGSARLDINSPLFIKLKGEFFGGTVDYDGQTQSGIPVETDTDYIGGRIEGNFGWKFIIAENSSIEPFIGPAARYWYRRIQGTDVGNVHVVEGREHWLSVYAPLGLRVSHTLNNGWSMFAEGGVKIPIYNENRADLDELYGVEVTIEPGREASYFAEAGLKWQMLRASVYYEGLRFSKSDEERERIDGGTLIVWQPESEADIFGMKIGWVF